jgi:hypothetical protein
VWVDDYDEPAPDAATFGRETFRGGRAEAIAWVRSRNAASRMAYSDQARGWSPLPDTDSDIEI